MRLYINGKSTCTIRMYAEAKAVANTGAHTEISFNSPNGELRTDRILPSKYVVDDALAGIEFVSALERMDK
jgi:hypothetical protein